MVVLSVLSLSIETALHARSTEDVCVVVRIDRDDVSHADGNDGPGPWDALVPVNRFVATDAVRTVRAGLDGVRENHQPLVKSCGVKLRSSTFHSP